MAETAKKNPIFVPEGTSTKPKTFTITGTATKVEPGPTLLGVPFSYETVKGLVIDLVHVNTNYRIRTTTSNGGAFAFVQIPAGLYYMQCYPPDNLTLWPLKSTGDITYINHFDPIDGKTYDFEVKSNIDDFRCLLKKRTTESTYSGPSPVDNSDKDLPGAPPITPAKTTGRVSGKVWYEDGKPYASPVIVQLINLDTNKATQITTKPNGSYVFDDMEPGFYHLKVILPTGATHAASSFVSPISVIYPLTGLSGLINVTAGSDHTDKDIGLVFAKVGVTLKPRKPPEIELVKLETPLEQPGTISGKVWAGTTETPGPVTNVTLVNNITEEKYIIETNASGDFYFYNIPAGDYYLEIPFNVGTPVTKDATSILNVSTRKSDVFTVNGTDNVTGKNIGITPSTSAYDLASTPIAPPP